MQPAALHPGLIGAELKNVLDFPGGGLLFQLAKGRVTKTPVGLCTLNQVDT
jgi:hypothetical protein